MDTEAIKKRLDARKKDDLLKLDEQRREIDKKYNRALTILPELETRTGIAADVLVSAAGRTAAVLRDLDLVDILNILQDFYISKEQIEQKQEK